MALHLNPEVHSTRLDSEYFVEAGFPMTEKLKAGQEDNSDEQWVGFTGAKKLMVLVGHFKEFGKLRNSGPKIL